MELNRVVNIPTTVVVHETPVNDVIDTSNRWRSLVHRSLLTENHVFAVTINTRDICWYLILEKRVIVLGDSLGVHIGRIYKDGTIF